MTKAYCNICEKEVEVAYILDIKGIKHFKGKCGHTSTLVSEKNSERGIIYKCDGAGGINRV